MTPLAASRAAWREAGRRRLAATRSAPTSAPLIIASASAAGRSGGTAAAGLGGQMPRQARGQRGAERRAERGAELGDDLRVRLAAERRRGLVRFAFAEPHVQRGPPARPRSRRGGRRTASLRRTRKPGARDAEQAPRAPAASARAPSPGSFTSIAAASGVSVSNSSAASRGLRHAVLAFERGEMSELRAGQRLVEVHFGLHRPYPRAGVEQAAFERVARRGSGSRAPSAARSAPDRRE